METILTEEDKNLIKKIGLRIANKKVKVYVQETRESYTNDYVIVVPPKIDTFTTMAIAVHQAAHHRFKTVVKKELYEKINEEFIEISRVILDAFEDYRCNMLNHQIYPGFVNRFRDYVCETNTFQNGSNILLNTVMQVHHALEFEPLFDDTDTYPIWDLLYKQREFVEKYLSTTAMAIAVKKIVEKIIFYYLNDQKHISEEVQFNKKTRTPNFYSNSLNKKILKFLDEKYLDYEGGDQGILGEVEEELWEERNSILKMVEDLRKLPGLNKLSYERRKLKQESIPPIENVKLDSYETIAFRNADLIVKLRREFRQIMRSTNPGRGGRRGKIMARDLAKFVTSKGQYDRVFQINHNTYGANLMILVDESGSMTKRKLPIARETLISMMEALEDTKINTCVIGFAAKNGSLVVSEKVYKRFNEPINRKKLASINTTEGYIYNRDGDSFELAAKHFAETNHKNSIMIIISDGCPNHGNYQGKEGRRLTNLSIRRIRNRGIEVYALGIKIYLDIQYQDMYDNKGVTFIDTHEIESALTSLIRNIATELIIDPLI